MAPVKIDVYTQYVSDNGYEIIKDVHLQYIAAKGGKLSPQTTILEKHPALFTEFAGLAEIPGVDCLIQFANKYGLLKPYEEHTHSSISGIEASVDTPRESCTFWATQSLLMSTFLDMWQSRALKKSNSSIARKCINLNSPGFEKYKQLLQNRGELPRGEFTSGEDSLVVKFDVQQIINCQLKEYPVTPCLLFDEKNDLKQYFRPSSLLSLMWFQFFRYVTGQQKIKQCPVCSDWYDVSDDSNKTRWNNRCTKCANRLRVQKTSVKKRYLSGLSVDEIIKKTKKTDPDIIKEWIQELEAEKNAIKN